jgi:Flp pilus assembly protein TadD
MDLMGVHWKTEHLPGSQYRVECYFLRALAYVSDDGIVNALYGVYLARRGRANDARTQFQLADKLEPLNADVQINIAFGLMQTGDWEEATKHARVAYANGYQLPGIRKKLVAKGYWKE